MLRHVLLLIFCIVCTSLLGTEWQQYTSRNGLVTGEVHQIIELPNGQLLVNCEGVFCLFNGRRFEKLACDRRNVMRLPHYTESYAHIWQSDTLLWIRDFYNLYAFDVRTRTFCYDYENHIERPEIQELISGNSGTEHLPASVEELIESVNLPFVPTTGLVDRQGGAWICTREQGIFYLPPQRPRAETLQNADEVANEVLSVRDSKGRRWRTNPNGLICYTSNSTICYQQTETGDFPNVHIKKVNGLLHNYTNFITPLPDGRLLLCNLMNVLGYFSPEECKFACLNNSLSAINHYRYLVGACPLAEKDRVLVYAQNGAFVLDTRADTLCPFIPDKEIAQYSDKYNCVLLDRSKRLWVGTQNGLFTIEATTMSDKSGSITKISGLTNDCIRSLVEGEDGSIWVGTSCGISRIAKGVTNLDEVDGVPNVPMTERAAVRLADGRMAFQNPYGFTVFHPSWFAKKADAPSVVLVGMSVCGQQSANEFSSFHSLPHNQNDLTVQFSALNYAAPTHTHYRCRLLGLKDEWQTVSDGDLASVSYYALPPGHYTFEAQAEVDENGWGKTLQIAFRICPPWWLTWWAKILYVLAGVWAVCVFIATYLARKKARLIAENDDRVNRLFELRDEARHQFAENINVNPAGLASNADEEVLVQKLLTTIEANISDVSYTVDQLALDVGIGRTRLYKMMRTMLGITPNDFLRGVRLKHAARLLTTTPLPIAEVALKTGFNTPRYFSSHFKKMFGVLPSEYRDGKKPRENQDHSNMQ